MGQSEMEREYFFNILYRTYEKRWVDRYKFVLLYEDDSANREVHHILPKSLYGEYKDCEANLISISIRQHYLAHLILWKMTKDYKMGYALKLMHGSREYTNSRLFEAEKAQIASSRKGMCAKYDKVDKKIKLVKLNNIDSGRYVSFNAGRTRYFNLETNKFCYSQEVLDESKFVIGLPTCKHNTIYWNGNKRVRNKSDAIGRTTGFESGLAKLHDKSMKCYINLITKTYERLNVSVNEKHLFEYVGQNLNDMYVTCYIDLVFIGRKYLPNFLIERYQLLKKDFDLFYNKKLGYKRNDYGKNIIAFIDANKGKTIFEVGFRCMSLNDYVYSDKHIIANSEDSFSIYIGEIIEES